MKSPNIWAKLDDGSILDQNGIFRFISVDRLVDKILSGNCCIVCGKEKKAKDFNDEHVIPDWILRKFSIQNRTITLPNRTNIKYS